jgi:SWIM zinc finger
MRERWSATQVAALAPDASSLGAARSLTSLGKWSEHGASDGPPSTIWGLCRGSGSKPYQTCIDLDEPAFRCSCPSRKFPCKHALGLMFLWADGKITEAPVPAWVEEWHAGRAGRVAKAEARRAAAREPATETQIKAAARRAAQRDDRVSRGVAELAQWLDDQVRNGIAGLDRAGYAYWDALAARLVDAQAPGLARQVRFLATVASSGSGWDERLLAELGMLRLLTRAYERIDVLPPDLAASVRGHVGFTVPVEQVLDSPPIRDIWQVLGQRDAVDERVTTRRTWLRGRRTGRAALVLTFAAMGQALPADLVIGTELEADLCFYPGAVPLRALVAIRHSAPQRFDRPESTAVPTMLRSYADALSGDPWLVNWPAVVRGVLIPGPTWQLRDVGGAAVTVQIGADQPWHLVAAGGGAPVDVVGEWSPGGFRPLALYADGEVITA